MTIRIGIDPGINGALARLNEETGDVEFRDIDGSLFNAIDFLRESLALADFLEVPIEATMEKVHAIPGESGEADEASGKKRRVGMGASTAFNFGHTCGVLEGALMTLQIPYTLKTPQSWKARVFGNRLRGKPKDKQKSEARDEARRLYPRTAPFIHLVKHSDRAEALLIAHAGKIWHDNSRPLEPKAPKPTRTPPSSRVKAAMEKVGMQMTL